MSAAKSGDTVKVHYTGTLNDGSEFDSSRERDPLEFTIDSGQVIAGFNEAVTGMSVGDSKSVTIPANQAYGWQPDVIYLLRVQFERQGEQFFPSAGEFHSVYGVTRARLARIAEEGMWVMHPGPVNRGVELTDAVMSYERCLINQQVENGIATRMAVLYWLKPKIESPS